MNMPRLKFAKAIEILLWIAAPGVLAENVVLLRQNRHLREAVAPQIAAGTQLQMLSGLMLDGRPQPVSLPAVDSKLLIITFSPGCPACQANQEGWKMLTGTLEKKGIRTLWFSRDPIEITRDYCLKHGIPVSDTLVDPPYRTYLQLGLARVPNMVLIGAGGKVERVWAGRLDQAGWDSVLGYFGQGQQLTSSARNELRVGASDCGTEMAGVSAKSCK